MRILFLDLDTLRPDHLAQFGNMPFRFSLYTITPSMAETGVHNVELHFHIVH